MYPLEGGLDKNIRTRGGGVEIGALPCSGGDIYFSDADDINVDVVISRKQIPGGKRPLLFKKKSHGERSIHL